jgi:anti-sigma factor RsiW
MHEPVAGRLEDYLLGEADNSEANEHLENCESCRKELEAMRRQSALFGALKASSEVEPDAGFYGRVMNRIESQAKPSAWSLFGESVFARRLAYASMTLFVLVGTYFVSSHESPDSLRSPEVMLASDEYYESIPVQGNNPQQDREAVLVNLVTYEQDFE